MMRLLHLADVHLDTPFSGRDPAVRKRLRHAVRDAFRRGVDLALREEVDAVVIAGDLFDSDTFTFETERFLVGELRRLTEQGVTVVHATGNHDPGEEGTARALEWPEGVHRAAGITPVRVPVHNREGELVGTITAVGHRTSREGDDLSVHFPDPAGLLPEVAVLHAQVGSSAGADAHARYAPTTVEALRRRGYDYWALGHVHRRQQLLAEPAIHYPGNLQGRTHAESGPRGGLLVDIERGYPARGRFHPLAPVRWETLEVGGLDDLDNVTSLVRHLVRRWEEWLADEPGLQVEWMIRMRLFGGSPLWRDLRDSEERRFLEQELATEVDAIEVTVDVDGVHAPIDAARHMERDDVLGEALRAVRDLRAGEGDPGRFEESLRGWDPGSSTLAEYLHALLAGGDAELVSRMTHGDD